jgi:hypothetical protein
MTMKGKEQTATIVDYSDIFAEFGDHKEKPPAGRV